MADDPTDARLKAFWLEADDGTWVHREPDLFDPDTPAYETVVGFARNRLTLKAKPFNEDAGIEVTGGPVLRVVDRHWDVGVNAYLQVPEGTTIWTVTVTSADGNATREYRMTVRRVESEGTESKDASLKTLEVTALETDGVSGRVVSFGGFVLDLHHSHGTPAQSAVAVVTHDTARVAVTAAATDPLSELWLRRSGGALLPFVDDETAELDLDYGRTVLELEVTPTDEGYARVHRVTFFRPPPVRATLEALDPVTRNGIKYYLFDLRTDSGVTYSLADLREHAFTVTDGRITSANTMVRWTGYSPVSQTSRTASDHFRFEAVLDGSAPIEVALVADRACADGAPCDDYGAPIGNAPSLTLPSTAPATEAGPLTARFENAPPVHDGHTPFTFRIAFSEAVATSYVTMRDHAVTVTGATVTGARRVDGRSDLWELTVEPSGPEPVFIEVPHGRACTEEGALCTADGRVLSVGLMRMILGPPPGGVEPAPDALTASFEGVPAEHDGQTPFNVRLSFSAPIGISYATLRDTAVTAAGGTATGARRVDGRSDLWELTVEPAGTGAVTVTLAATAACGEPGAVCTSDGRALAGPVSATVEGPSSGQTLDALTASFEEVPAEHDGETPFKLALSFSAPVGISWVTLRDEAVTATGATVTGVRRVGSSALWELTVEPSGTGEVTLTLAATAACGEPGAVCTGDGRALANAPSVTVAGPPGLSVADAEVEEAAGAALAFAVTLSRPSSGTVTVAYATSDGTATAGADYTAVSDTLTFEVGETQKTVSVAVLDDAHDEGDETLTLVLSSPSGAYLADGEATGTITNTDHIPQAWLARFGRTVADQVLDAVESRMTAARTSGAALTIAGQRIGGGGASPDVEALEAREAEADLEALSDWLRGEAGDERAALGSREVTGRELLTGTSFALAGGTAEGGFGALWGRGAVTRFDGREGELDLDGDVASALVGADFTRGRSAAGLVLSHSRGDGDYRSPDGSGEVESTLTGLYPWGRYEASERLSVWGVVGLGAGTLTLTPEAQAPMAPAPIETDLDLAMGAVGARGVLVKAPAEGGLELAAKSDALVVRTSSDRVLEDGMSLAASEADVTRLRLGLEGTFRGIATRGGGRFEPGFELGVRHDGGDAEHGFGADIGAGLAWTDPSRGIEAELRARGLLTHEAGGFRERGFAGAFAWDPAPSTERGPSLTLRQTVGAPAAGGMDALLGPESARVLGAADDDGDELERRTLEAKLGYGFAAFGERFTSTPSLGLSLTDTHRETVLGWRLAEARTRGLVFGLDVEGARRESAAGDDGPEHRLGLGFGWRLEGAGAERFELRFEGVRVDAATDGGPEHRLGVNLTARW